jgi:hypothetical protein
VVVLTGTEFGTVADINVETGIDKDSYIHRGRYPYTMGLFQKCSA